MVPRFSIALSTNPAILYHPRRPEFNNNSAVETSLHCEVGGGFCGNSK